MKTSRTSMRFLFGLALATTPLAGGCGKKDVPPEAAPTTTAPATKEGEGQPRRDLEPGTDPKTEDKPAAVAAPALPGPFATAGLYAVPKGAPFVVVGSAKKMLDAIGYAGLLDKYGMMLGSVGEKLVELTGKDFFKLASWGEVGIDLESPMGIYMPELSTQAIITFVPLSDAAKLIAFVTETAKKVEAPLVSEKVGDATLFTMGDRDKNAYLVKGSLLYAVTVMRGNGAAAIAKEIIDRKEADSIASLPELKTSLEGVAADELGAFVQLKSILEKTMLARAESPMKLAMGEFEKQLEDAKKSGDAATVARVEAAIASEKEYFERTEKRRAAELEMAKAIVAEVSVLTIGLDISEVAAEATLHMPLADGGMLKGLLKNASDMQPILKATKTEPLVALSFQVDPAAYLGLIEKAMATDGESLAEVRTMLTEKLGVDLDKDIIGALSGELGFALTGDAATLMKSKEPAAELGGALVIGLKSDAGLKAIVAKVAAQEGASTFLKWDEATSTLNVTIPEQKPVQVVFTGNRMIASTDLDTAARLAGSETFVAGVTNPKLKALLERKDLAALMTLSQSFVGGWMLLGATSRNGFTPPMPDNATAQVQAKYEEIAKLDAEIQPLRAAVEEARMKPMFAALEKLGTMAQAVTVNGQGVQATMGVYTKGATVPEVIADLIEMGMNVGKREAGEGSEADKRLRDLEDQRWKLESQLWDANRPKPEEAAPAVPDDK